MTFTYKVSCRLLFGLAALSMLLLTFAPLAQAQETGAVSRRIPVTFAMDNPCTGEPVLIEGAFHLVLNETEDQSGGTHTVGHSNFNGHGVSTSGVRYTFQSVDNSPDKVDADSADDFTITSSFRLVRQGETAPTDDSTLHVTVHVTQNANGEFTATPVHINSECR